VVVGPHNTEISGEASSITVPRPLHLVVRQHEGGYL
jgi:hypothetical protein